MEGEYLSNPEKNDLAQKLDQAVAYMGVENLDVYKVPSTDITLMRLKTTDGREANKNPELIVTEKVLQGEEFFVCRPKRKSEDKKD